MSIHHGSLGHKLSKLQQSTKVKHLDVDLGAFRDDWLGFSRLTARQTDNVKKKTQKIFEKHGLKIDIRINKNIADYLDITWT